MIDAPHHAAISRRGLRLLDPNMSSRALHRRVLVVVEDPEEFERVADCVRAAPVRLQVQQVSTALLALDELQRHASEFCLVILEEQQSSDSVDLMGRMRALAPGISVILMNRRGPGAILVAYENSARRPNALPDEAITTLWRDLRAARRQIPANGTALAGHVHVLDDPGHVGGRPDHH